MYFVSTSAWAGVKSTMEKHTKSEKATNNTDKSQKCN
jgi:hypothetical protein